VVRLKLLRGSKDFFSLFEAMADKVDEGAQELLALLKSFDRVEDRVQRVLDIEHEGDEITHEIVREINTSFVAPLDREDIYHLASTLDDVLDEIEAAAECITLFRIPEPLPQMVGLADTLVRATELTAQAMPNLRNMKTKAGNLHEYVTRIDALEDEGDRMYRRTTAYLYGGDFKAMDVLRYEDIVKSIEGAINRLEDVANTIETIATKSA
jgi:predicted phosphate transport protein (TIGR00153 family)